VQWVIPELLPPPGKVTKKTGDPNGIRRFLAFERVFFIR